MGGFYFHPTDEDLSVGTPEMKKPRSIHGFGYSNSETAIDAGVSITAAACRSNIDIHLPKML